ncbi:SEC14-like protein 2 isoform X1 [Dermacentor albipictus]|uniref:SEC14-like protein 2 isoform X1 n=1 Tax=Dermacentor albipictus TaxID=60249 RepID=UPI0031FBC7EE
MSGYLGDLSARQQAALDKFREAVADVKKPWHSDACLLRWLRAREFDVSKAERMYRNDLEWRKENGVDDILSSYKIPEIVKENFPGAILHPCKDGRPMWLIPAGIDMKALVAALTPAVVQRHCIYLQRYTESLKLSVSKGAAAEIETHYLVIDVENFALRQVYSWQAVKTITDMLKMMEDHFPECLEKCIIVNAPDFFPTMWKLIRPFLTERTTDKVEIFAKADAWKERLVDIVGAASLPAHWGGDMVGPDGDTRCRHMVNYGGRFEEGPDRPTWSLFDEPGAKKRTIGRRDRWELQVNVSCVGVQLSWRFQTAAGDVAFGLRMRDGETLLPLRRIDASGQIPQEGSWHCARAGTYVLQFDNSYSWMTDKKLVYVVKVQASDKSHVP